MKAIRCVLCAGGSNGQWHALLGGARQPVCKRCWQRLFTHTNIPIFNYTGQQQVRRGFGRPAQPDADIADMVARCEARLAQKT